MSRDDITRRVDDQDQAGSLRSMYLTRRAALAGGILVTAAACSPGTSSQSSTGAPSESGSFTVTSAEVTDLEAWSPYAQSSTPSYSRWGNIFEPLATYDYDAKKLVGVLATDWKSSGVDWTFNLRKGVKFHDGSTFTAADVVHSFNRMLNDGDSLQASNFREIDKMTVVDDYTLHITTKHVDATFLGDIGPNRFISSKAAFEKYGSKDEADHHPSGTGPYKFVQWKRGGALVLEKNPDYWGDNKASPDKLVFTLIPEAAARTAALIRGEVDITRNLPVQDVSRVKNEQNVSVATVNGIRLLFFPMNPKFQPLDDVRVRQAICYAVDTQAIISGVLQGYMKPTKGPVPPQIFGSDPAWKPYPHDPEKAKQLLRESGHSNGIDLKLTTPTNRYPKDTEVAQAVAQQLKEVGIRVTVETPEFGTLSTNMSDGKLAFYQISRGGYFDGSEPMEQYFRTGVTKRTSYSNPRVDKLLDQSDKEMNRGKREKLLQQAGAIILKDAAAIFFGTYEDLYGLSKRVSWEPTPDERVYGIDMRRA